MHVKTLEVGYLLTNCYIIADEATKIAVVMDPGGDVAAILDYLEENELTPKAVFLTHGHFDHVMGVDTFLEYEPVPLYMNRADVDTDIGNETFHFSPPADTVFIDHGDSIDIGPLHFEVIGCPGHTPGSVTYKIEDCLFTGDTLFRLSYGRYDFPASDGQALLRSLRRLKNLPGSYDVYPGHGQSTTLDFERHMNPALALL